MNKLAYLRTYLEHLDDRLRLSFQEKRQDFALAATPLPALALCLNSRHSGTLPSEVHSVASKARVMAAYG